MRSLLMRICLCALFVLTVPFETLADIRLNVPLYGQRDSRWSSDQLGTCSNTTIGDYGCAVTSIAMVLKYYGVDVTPKTLDDWLTTYEGYSSGCIVNWGIADNKSSGNVSYAGSVNYTSIPADLAKIQDELDNGYPVIAEVRLSGYQHFVVITGYSGSTFYINDPWYNDSDKTINSRYGSPATAIYGIRMYHGNPPATSGWVSVSSLSISPSTVVLGQNFNINFTLKEVNNASKTFQKIAVAILDSSGNLLYDAKIYDTGVTIPAKGAWSQTVTTDLYTSRPTGTYKAIIRGMLNGNWFDFDAIGSGTNPRSFSATLQGSTTPIPGDINKDGKVDIYDFSLLSQNFLKTDCGNLADINGDCRVDIYDFAVMSANWGRSQ